MVGTQTLTFVAAVLALLATPGPTNTLLAASGAAVGLRRSLKLLLAECAGYLISIAVLTLALGPIVAKQSSLAFVIRLAAAAWLIGSAAQLWLTAGRGLGAGDTSIDMTRVFVTTLLNPKALIFALGAGLAYSAGALATPRRIWRIASVGLAGFAMVVAASAVGAMH